VLAAKELDVSDKEKEIWLGEITINGILFQ
jgi:hypothetical protein